MQWVDPDTGYSCLAARTRTGIWCGYVGVPATHPLHGCEDYWECSSEIMQLYGSVHGGLTYADCSLPLSSFSLDPSLWWFGFDCGHDGDADPMFPKGADSETIMKLHTQEDWEQFESEYDREHYRDAEFVVHNAKRLADRLADYGGVKQIYGIQFIDPGISVASSSIDAALIKELRQTPQNLHSLSPRQFEELIATLLQKFGWQTELTKTSRDGGYDIYAVTKDGAGVRSSWIIECKKYASNRKIGVNVVRALYGLRAEQQVSGAILATTSHFTADAQKYKASRFDLHLKDYYDIIDWLDQYDKQPDQ